MMLAASVGSPYGTASNAALALSTAASYWLLGTSSRVGIAQPCPAWKHIPPAPETAAATPTTPTGSFETSRAVIPIPKGSFGGSDRDQEKLSVASAGQSSASANGLSSWGP